ncbi:MAG: hypothetical protein K2M76_05165, partial [Muribaculaceae bacterium]|nr:hypothetical protein [Muribaculaceae bacterium]
TSLNYPALISHADALLRPSGTIALIAPTDTLPIITEAAAMARLHFARLAHLYTKPDKAPIRILCELSADASQCATTHLLLNSPDYNSIVAQFYLKL